LRNALRTAAALCSNNCIRLSNLPQEIVDPLDPAPVTPPSTAYVRTSEPPASPLEGAERAALVRTLEKQGWNVSQTARALDISRNTLYRKLHKHRIAVPRDH
jgi:transcriptional regulator of acetoin/glycerol metabolism